MYIYIYTYNIYIYTYIYIYIYRQNIYIYRERERERDIHMLLLCGLIMTVRSKQATNAGQTTNLAYSQFASQEVRPSGPNPWK